MPFVIVGLIAAGFAFRSYYATPSGRRTIDGLTLRMPVLGLLMRKIAVARFCRTLSTLLASGVSILDAIDITARAAGNAVVEDALVLTRGRIEHGETVAQPLKETRVFPAMVVQMISVGEATGALDTMLSKIADFYEEEVDVAVAGLLTLLEPLMIAVLGGIVGGIVIAMYMPIFSMVSNLT
jgi:type IV pilus assembly protein PilC